LGCRPSTTASDEESWRGNNCELTPSPCTLVLNVLIEPQRWLAVASSGVGMPGNNMAQSSLESDSDCLTLYPASAGLVV